MFPIANLLHDVALSPPYVATARVDSTPESTLALAFAHAPSPPRLPPMPNAHDVASIHTIYYGSLGARTAGALDVGTRRNARGARNERQEASQTLCSMFAQSPQLLRCSRNPRLQCRQCRRDNIHQLAHPRNAWYPVRARFRGLRLGCWAAVGADPDPGPRASPESSWSGPRGGPPWQKKSAQEGVWSPLTSIKPHTLIATELLLSERSWFWIGVPMRDPVEVA